MTAGVIFRADETVIDGVCEVQAETSAGELEEVSFRAVDAAAIDSGVGHLI